MEPVDMHLYPGQCQKNHDQQVKGGHSTPLLYPCEIIHGALDPALEASARERHGHGEASLQRRPQR